MIRLPADARIEGLSTGGRMEPADLKTELDRWNVFRRGQDRFFTLLEDVNLI